jgi:O-antigen/teichoic acid export membrane protein
MNLDGESLTSVSCKKNETGFGVQPSKWVKEDTMAGLIPLVSIMSVFGAGVVIVAIIMLVHYKKEVMRNKERMAAIEKGITPADLEASTRDHWEHQHRDSSLKSGIIVLFVGMGLALALWVNSGIDGAVWGIFVGLIGVGNLIYYFVAGRKEEAYINRSFPRDEDTGIS